MSTNPDTREDNKSGSYFATTLPEWKQELWHDISAAAEAKFVFEKRDYDEDGDLNMHLMKFKDLYRWLAARNNEEQFKTLKAEWRHVREGRWQLTFLVQDNDPPAADEPECSSDRQRVRRKLTDLYVDGLKSASQKDWVMVQTEAIPPHEDLPKDMLGSRKQCLVM